MFAARLFVWLGAAYLIIGIVVATISLVRGLDRIDASAKGASISFRLLMIPGLCLLWPIIVQRFREETPRRESTAHKDLW